MKSWQARCERRVSQYSGLTWRLHRLRYSSLTHMITQLVVIPAPMITGYLIGGLGIKFAFVLAGIFLLIADLVLAPLQLYRGMQKS